MLSIHDSLYDINLVSVSLRIFLAFIFSGIIGLERGANRHPAGFRTYILVCIGATLAMITNQFMLQTFGTGDPARLGAQVITGVGFLGVGTIIITGKNKIRGLTTAAGLWSAACLGLALGIGFYSGAVIAAIVIFISLALLPKLENYFYRRIQGNGYLHRGRYCRKFQEDKTVHTDAGSLFYEVHIAQSPPVSPAGIPFNISIRLPKDITHREAIETLEKMDGVLLVEEF
ncbi:MAG: MgtC/SapB family protein [Anaerovoracaceae bacterium]